VLQLVEPQPLHTLVYKFLLQQKEDAAQIAKEQVDVAKEGIDLQKQQLEAIKAQQAIGRAR
jgi:hypothetical protein